ncbi:hypothetical protein RSSM_00647 [Rhodopirellula sallentina SM41]|uniref:Uncharacterized protein n=1 Tax=Rhodopirellula sallentina SM41 TaxID=1263870 RepID=M5U8Z4_9BACT|nr:hypothetical protein RSSM_00647 [Rhodopirellula sallentina SM41]
MKGARNGEYGRTQVSRENVDFLGGASVGRRAGRDANSVIGGGELARTWMVNSNRDARSALSA